MTAVVILRIDAGTPPTYDGCMITRLYANNFRCLVAFEAAFDSFGVLCGPNGAGKSSVFDAMRLLRNLATGDAMLGGKGEQDIPSLEFTEWLDSTVQEFELGLSVDGHAFKYVIHFEQKADFEKPRIVHEGAVCDGQALFERHLEGVRFQKSDGSQTGFPLDWRQAALAAIQPRGSIGKLALLQEEVAKLLILRPNPRGMERESKAKGEAPGLVDEQPHVLVPLAASGAGVDGCSARDVAGRLAGLPLVQTGGRGAQRRGAAVAFRIRRQQTGGAVPRPTLGR